MTDIINTIKTVSDKLKPFFKEDKQNMETTEQHELNQQSPDIGQIQDEQSSQKENTKPTNLEIIVSLLNGLGVGLLLGLLLGLAVSPVVSSIIGTLSSLLVILLGLNDKYMSVIKSLRIGSFGIFAVVGILLGMYIRTQNALSPTTSDLMREYTETGFEKNEALYYVARQTFDFVPIGWFGTSAADTGKFKGGNNAMQSVLFSTEVDLGQCYVLNSAKTSFPKSEIIRSFKRAGGIWEELAINLEPLLPDQVFINAMIALRDSFCGLGTEGKIEIKSSPALLSLSANSELDEIKKSMSDLGGNWKIVLENTEKTIPVENQKTLYLELIKIFNDEKNN
ncbi:MAG: hypothetical protein R2757_05815 [Draconibacterium sp.]